MIASDCDLWKSIQLGNSFDGVETTVYSRTLGNRNIKILAIRNPNSIVDMFSEGHILTENYYLF